ncbi:MAG TPA: GrpB family protein [Pseudonocardia sp.]|nr:GrpB family protein [Pseudonocardia sp.]
MADALTDDALAAKLVRGLRPTRVTLVEYDPEWPARFRARAAEVRGILGDRARLVEHVGSTSVPGLAAKPVIDIVAGIDDPDDEAAFLPDLEAAGYALRVREPQHRCLRAGDPHDPVNLHCYPPDHEETRKYLVFRDRLRASPADRARYEAVKRELAQREWRDMNYYAEAKGPVIREILARAGWRSRGEQGRDR